MSDQAVVDCLVAARKRIENPANWGKGEELHVYSKTCTLLALQGDSFVAAATLLMQVTGEGALAFWNDAPERTHEDVLRAYDAAIELARSN